MSMSQRQSLPPSPMSSDEPLSGPTPTLQRTRHHLSQYWALRRRRSRIMLVLQQCCLDVLKVSRAFVVVSLCVPLEIFDFDRAPILAHGMFPEGILLERNTRAPTVCVAGRRRGKRHSAAIGEGVAKRRFLYCQWYSGGCRSTNLQKML